MECPLFFNTGTQLRKNCCCLAGKEREKLQEQQEWGSGRLTHSSTRSFFQPADLFEAQQVRHRHRHKHSTKQQQKTNEQSQEQQRRQQQQRGSLDGSSG
jgi:hypothetical protein